jgi:hypothetical protein
VSVNFANKYSFGERLLIYFILALTATAVVTECHRHQQKVDMERAESLNRAIENSFPWPAHTIRESKYSDRQRQH